MCLFCLSCKYVVIFVLCNMALIIYITIAFTGKERSNKCVFKSLPSILTPYRLILTGNSIVYLAHVFKNDSLHGFNFWFSHFYFWTVSFWNSLRSFTWFSLICIQARAVRFLLNFKQNKSRVSQVFCNNFCT